MTALMVGRVAAVVLSATTFVFLFVHDSWRADNLFLVPDLVLCGLLAVGAVLPARFAGTVLVVGFGVAAGVFATSVASYAVDGELGLPSLVGAVTAVALAAITARTHESRPRSS